MIPNIHQSIDEIIKGATPTQKILWQQIRLLTGENASVLQYFCNGALFGSEFNVGGTPRRLYLSTKLILTANILTSTTENAWGITNPFGGITVRSSFFAWDTTAAAFRYTQYPLQMEDIIFSSITTSFGATIAQIYFIGYKITY